jgi:hypothetical protein
MKKKYYTATATMRDATHEWNVVIYSRYETMGEAQEAAARFKNRYGSMVIKIEIK